MAHNGDVCPHLHGRLTSHIIASFFSKTSHRVSLPLPLSILQVGFYLWCSLCLCQKKGSFVHLYWAVLSLDLICSTQLPNTCTIVHEQLNTTPPHLSEAARVCLSAVWGEIQEDTQPSEEEEGKIYVFLFLTALYRNSHWAIVCL